jgi:hypothetical protein
MPTQDTVLRSSLCDVLDRVLNAGVVVAGEVTISVADIDLIWLRLHLTLASAQTAREHGLSCLIPLPQAGGA